MNVKKIAAALALMPTVAMAGFSLDEALDTPVAPIITLREQPAPSVQPPVRAIEAPKVAVQPLESAYKQVQVTERPSPFGGVSIEKTNQSLNLNRPDQKLSQSGSVLIKNMGAIAPRFAQGVGRDIPLGLAITQIIQSDGWVVRSEPMVNMKKAVTWEGGKPWIDCLDDVLYQIGYSAEIDQNEKVVMVYARATPIENRVWELDPADGSLRRSLDKWAKMAGWQVVWELSYDFPVALYARVEGTFEDALSAVSKSVRNTETPVKLTLYEGNRVVRVSPADGSKRR